MPRPDRRWVRLSLTSVLLATAAFYAWYCAPIRSGAGNVALATLLGIAAAVCATLAVRLVARTPEDCAPRPTVKPVTSGGTIEPLLEPTRYGSRLRYRFLPSEAPDKGMRSWGVDTRLFDRSTGRSDLLVFVSAAIDQRPLFPDNGLCRGQS
jgi:hypothetical protein